MKTKTKRAARDCNWTKRAAVERLCGKERQAVVEVGGMERTFERYDNLDFYLVSTDDFLPLASKGSVLEVWTSDAGLKTGAPVLVAGRDRLEIKRYSKDLREQILGAVVRTEAWPGEEAPTHYLL